MFDTIHCCEKFEQQGDSGSRQKRPKMKNNVLKIASNLTIRTSLMSAMPRPSPWGQVVMSCALSNKCIHTLPRNIAALLRKHAHRTNVFKHTYASETQTPFQRCETWLALATGSAVPVASARTLSKHTGTFLYSCSIHRYSTVLIYHAQVLYCTDIPRPGTLL